MNQAAAAVTSFRGTSRFEVVGTVGQGGAGVVYEVHDRERDARLALKALRTPNAETILLLKNEFRAVQDVQHPNLVHLDELFEENGQWFFTMEFVPGQDFLTYVRAPSAGATFDDARLRGTLGQLVRGLCALHTAQKVHRDVKPSNVLVTPEGRAVILDFGVVSDLARAGHTDDGIVGTAFYMAPEQAASEAVGPAADWYAVGVMLYQALTGRLPFVGTMHDVLDRKLTTEAPAPRTLAPDVPADLDALCVDLLRIDPAARPDGPAILRRLALDGDAEAAAEAAKLTATSTVFVGRRAELDALEGAYADTRAGRGVTVLVHGESGVGKSFLVRAFTDRAQERGATLFRGRCYERESVPYKAVDGIVDDLCAFLLAQPDADVAAVLPPAAGLLCKVFPVIEQVPAIAQARAMASDVVNPKQLRTRVFAALRALLGNVAQRWPLVLVIDDLQWADADSLALLAQVTQPPDAPPFLLLATLRAATETRVRVQLKDMAATRLLGDVRDVHLEPLPPDDAVALATQLLGAGAAGAMSPAAVRALAAEAKGHPLFIDELIRQRATRGGDAAPARLDEAVWLRVQRLEPAARHVLELVAVAGMPLAQGTAAQAAALDFGQLVPLVSTLRGANFVRTAGVHRDDAIEPYHDRVRESVLAHLEPAVRATWHGRLAVALERATGADLEALATHWKGAGDVVRAASYAARGAEQAAAALAFDHAVRLYRFAFELQPPTGAAGTALKVKLAEALTNAGRGAEAARVYLEAAGSDASPAGIDLRRIAAEQFLCSGHFDDGVATLREALAAVGESFPASQGAALASVLYHRLRLRTRGVAFEPREAAQIDPRVLRRIDCLGSAGSGFAMIEPVRGTGFHARTLLEALKAGEPRRVARAMGFHAIGLGSGGGPRRAQTEALLAKLWALLATLPPDPHLEGVANTAAGCAGYFVGDWARGWDALVRAEETFRDRCIGASYELNVVRLLIVRTLAFRGDLQELARRGPAYLREADQKGDLHSSVSMRGNPAYQLALADDDAARAEQEITEAERHLTAQSFQLQHMYCLAARGQIALYRGDAAAAHGGLVEKWATIKRALIFVVQPTHIFTLEQRARSALALATAGATPDAALLRAVEADVRTILGEKMQWSAPFGPMLRAGVARARGDLATALAEVTRAAEGFAAQDMSLHAAVARRRRGELLGGDEGRALVTAADAWMHAQGVRNPERMAAVYAPGFGR